MSDRYLDESVILYAEAVKHNPIRLYQPARSKYGIMLQPDDVERWSLWLSTEPAGLLQWAANRLAQRILHYGYLARLHTPRTASFKLLSEDNDEAEFWELQLSYLDKTKPKVVSGGTWQLRMADSPLGRFQKLGERWWADVESDS